MNRLALLATALPLLGTPAAAEGTTSLGPTAQQRLEELLKEKAQTDRSVREQLCTDAKATIAKITDIRCLENAAANQPGVVNNYLNCTEIESAAIDNERDYFPPPLR